MKKILAILLAAILTLAAVSVLAEETQAADDAEVLAVQDAQILNNCYTRAVNAIAAEDYDTAKAYLTLCFAYCDRQSDPVMFTDLLLKLGWIAKNHEQNSNMALLFLNAALRIQPDNASAYLVKADVYMDAGENGKAVENLEKYIELSQDTNLYKEVAQLEEASGNLAAAQEAFDKYAKGAGAEVEDAVFQSGLYKMQVGKLEEAAADFETYLENETYAGPAYYYIGLCKLQTGDFAGAAEALTSCEGKGQIYDGLYYYRGQAYFFQYKWEEAEKDFIKSIETDQDTADAKFKRAICRMQLEDYEGAAALFTECIGDGAGQAETASAEAAEVNYGAYYYRAYCEASLGQLEAALADYTVCIDNRFELSQSYSGRAEIYAAMGETEKQNADIDQAMMNIQ